MAKAIKDLKIKGQEVFEAVSSNPIKSIDEEKRILTIRGSDETQDRDGDIIMVSGWELENYKKNPVFLWAHNYSSVPIGAAIKVIQRRIPVPHLEFQIRFPTEGLYSFADTIFDLYKEKIINASSVGFFPTKWEELNKDEFDPDDSFWKPKRFVKQELWELSGVPVPSNPAALQNFVGEKKMDSLMGRNIPHPEKMDDLLGELEVKRMEIEQSDKAVMVQVKENLENKEEEKEVDEAEEVEYSSDEKDFIFLEKIMEGFLEKLEGKMVMFLKEIGEKVLEQSKEPKVIVSSENYSNLLGFEDKKKESLDITAFNDALKELKKAVKKLN